MPGLMVIGVVPLRFTFGCTVVGHEPVPAAGHGGSPESGSSSAASWTGVGEKCPSPLRTKPAGAAGPPIETATTLPSWVSRAAGLAVESTTIDPLLPVTVPFPVPDSAGEPLGLSTQREQFSLAAI